jgi:hypothetical protein
VGAVMALRRTVEIGRARVSRLADIQLKNTTCRPSSGTGTPPSAWRAGVHKEFTTPARPLKKRCLNCTNTGASIRTSAIQQRGAQVAEIYKQMSFGDFVDQAIARRADAIRAAHLDELRNEAHAEVTAAEHTARAAAAAAN